MKKSKTIAMTELPEGLSILTDRQHGGRWFMEFAFVWRGQPSKYGLVETTRDLCFSRGVEMFPKVIAAADKRAND